MADSRAGDSEGERGTGLNNRGTNEAMNVIFTDPQILDCYICCEPLAAPVYQCENGRISCSSCCTKVKKKCPSCSLPIGYIRCRAIEKVLESIEIPCQNSKYGCQMTMSLTMITSHCARINPVLALYPIAYLLVNPISYACTSPKSTKTQPKASHITPCSP